MQDIPADYQVSVLEVASSSAGPELIFVMCIDCEVIGWDGFIMYSIIGVLNVALYALVGAAVAFTRQKPSPNN